MAEVRTILCPVDFTPLSFRSLRMAVEMCRRIGAKLIVHHNLESRPPGFLSVRWMWSEDHEAGDEERRDEVPAKLEELFAEIPEGVDYEARVTRGPMEETLLFVARGLPADLIIMGTHGKSSSEHDSLTERIVIGAPCSVVTIGEDYSPAAVFDVDQTRPPREMRFLVPVDFSPRTQGVLGFAFELSKSMPHRLDVLHVVPGAYDAEQVQHEMAAARERLERLVPSELGDRARVHVRVGDPTVQILEAAREFEVLCVVMGAHAKGMLRRFLFGTKTMSLLHGASCPVWFVPESLTLQ